MSSDEIDPKANSLSGAGSGRRRLCVLLFWLEAGLIGCAVPITLLALLASAWEGGDVAWKHRLIAWAPAALLGQVLAVPLLGLAGAAVRRGAMHGVRLAWAGIGLVAVLATGWAYVGAPQPLHGSDATFDLAVWLIWTGPAALAAILMLNPRGLRK